MAVSSPVKKRIRAQGKCSYKNMKNIVKGVSRTESGLKNKLKKGLFTVTVEISSPKGTDLERVLADVRELEDYADAVNICDNPMANMRMGAIPLAHIIQERTGVETIPHLACRDGNVIGLQSEVLGAWALGIRNIFVGRIKVCRLF
ncbi:methylenetetrahydrofolate reductase [Thermoanaerobacterium sp. DL9XJH110]|uniref:methylenetetrahydrofolate reductase n=1 Tax=Thermoanaerobacterium sp. DL9XJH110 TaxID=3386643 RepID=UPI003BB5B9E1